jgi:hypothetical protein
LCKALKKDGSTCTQKTQEDSQFCGTHAKLGAKTKEEIESAGLKQCSDCKNFRKLENGYSTCDQCQARSANNRKKAREQSSPCKGITYEKKACSYQALDGEEFCEKHLKLKDFHNTGKVKCSTLNCYNEAEQNRKRCFDCREGNRQYEQEVRTEHLEKVKRENNEQEHICHNSKCRQKFKPFKNRLGNDSTKCPPCYSGQCEYERKRPLRKRDWKQEFINNPERAQKKRERLASQKLINPGRFVEYWIRCRLKQREELGEEEYKKRQRERMVQYRKEYPERIRATWEKNWQENLEQRLKQYKRIAHSKGKQWFLTDEEAKTLFLSPCFYCGYKHEQKLNGIDELIYNGTYNSENCVPCCKICNFMKGCLDVDVFIIRCIEITNYNGVDQPNEEYQQIDSSSYDGTGADYSSYKHSAAERKIQFDLSPEEFLEKVQMPCYLCGKKNSENHQNGLDRVVNKEWYYYENCESCCSCCNYMKKELELDTFLNHCHLIMLCHQNSIDLENLEFCIKFSKTCKHIQKHLNKVQLEKTDNTVSIEEWKALPFAQKVNMKLKNWEANKEKKKQDDLERTTLEEIVSQTDIYAKHIEKFKQASRQKITTDRHPNVDLNREEVIDDSSQKVLDRNEEVIDDTNHDSGHKSLDQNKEIGKNQEGSTADKAKEYFKNYRRQQRGKNSETTRAYNSREGWTEEDFRKYKAENKRQQRLRQRQ